jgi:acyl-CoA reductase-like NAD-dependent aldehyde dehydrogenase
MVPMEASPAAVGKLAFTIRRPVGLVGAISPFNFPIGGVTVNEAPTFRADQMPYGAVKPSGNAREGPAYTSRECTEARLIVTEL